MGERGAEAGHESRSSAYARWQEELNRASAGQWAGYAHHRAAVTGCVLAQAPAGAGRLVVLGAGNCNDLDLAEVASAFREVHLVDLDSAAVQQGVERQGMGSATALHIHGGVDVTRLLEECPFGVGSADVVLSAGVMSQLIGGAADEGHDAAGLLQVRDAHLHTMIGLLRRGGIGVLINDVVSSDTCPQLPTTPEEQLPLLLARLLEERNFFTGCNPFAIAQRLTDPPYLATDLSIITPWRWDIGARSYLVCAVSFLRDTEAR